MAVTLTESAKLSNNALQRGVIEAITTDQPLISRLRFENIEGNAFAYNREGTGAGAAFRAVNAGYTESTSTFTNKVVQLAILGGDAAVDRFIAQTRGNINDQRAAQTVAKAKATARAFQDAFINGDYTGTSGVEFDGLNVLLTGSSQVVTAAANGLNVVGSSDDHRHQFLDKLTETTSLVPGASLILMNDSILGKFRSSARRLSQYDETKDEFGKVVTTFNGIPVVAIGNDASGNPIIPQSEVQGSSGATCSSVYIVNLNDENGVIGLTNGGVQAYDLGESDAKPQYITRIDFYCAIAPMAPNSAAVLRGVLNG
jgi:hypothetical protein